MKAMVGRQCEDAMLRLQQGQKNALSAIYDAAGRNMFALALSIVQDYQLAEDVLQESLLQILQNAKSVNNPGHTYAWVMTIVRNTAFNMLRSRQREISTEDIAGEMDAMQNTGMTEADFELGRALARLPLEEKQIVLLKAVMGFRHSEIAKMLDISVMACQKRYTRSLKLLKQYLKESDSG